MNIIDTPMDWTALRGQPFELLQALERRLRASRLDLTSTETNAWVGLGFRLHNYWLVTPREDVREVTVVPRLTRVPGAKPWLCGVANVRGNLLPVTDLAQLVGLPRVVDSRNRRVLVLNIEGVPTGFLVDEVAGYRQFAPADQRHELTTNAAQLAPYLLGGFHRENRDWLVLSLRKLARADVFAHAGA
ncbi:MAG: chemotaxis protein CheW [Nevskia sp.]|nr:chemotaxis protein CheW [Nevskia sp.]MCK9385250.1 chemotaxis protein CheW [Nevskia sp.]